MMNKQNLTLYVCDLKKNTDCIKWREKNKHKLSCEYEPSLCEFTKNPKFAKRDENGRPIVAKLEGEAKKMTGFKINDEIEQAYRQGFTDAKAPAAAQVVQIRGKLPSLNDYIGECRKNPHAGAKMKKDAETLIMVQLGRMQRITSPVIIHFEWHEKNARRDKDNVAAAKKFILDAMQKAGKLENDNNRFIAGFSDSFVYGVDYGVVLRIEGAKK